MWKGLVSAAQSPVLLLAAVTTSAGCEFLAAGCDRWHSKDGGQNEALSEQPVNPLLTSLLKHHH